MKRRTVRNTLCAAVACLLLFACGKSEEPSGDPVVVEVWPGARLVDVACAPATSKGWEVYGVTDDEKDPFLNLREGRSTKTTILAKLTEGTPLELLKSKKKWREVKVTGGEHVNVRGWVHQCCLKPQGSLDHYYAVLSRADHHNSKGVRLKSAASVLRQDRANFHRFGKRDKRDRSDEIYITGDAREFLEKAFRECGSKEVAKQVLGRNAEVWVTTYPSWVNVTIAKKGPRVTRAKRKKLTPAQCEAKHCGCMSEEGGDCDDRKMRRCTKRAGVEPYDCGAG